MFRYIETIPAWGLQISALKHAYADKNITVHITREFGNTDALHKDGTGQTAPLYYVLQNGKVARLETYLRSRYPNANDYTNLLMQKIAETQNKQVAQPVAEPELLPDEQPSAQEPIHTEEVNETKSEDNTALRNDIKKILTEEMAEVKKDMFPVAQQQQKTQTKKMQRLVEEYDPNKSFAQEYQWVPSLFDWLYFIVSPIIAIFGAFFFYAQVNNRWLLAGLVVMFLALELIFRRTIVRKCVAAFMRGRYVFGSITLVMASVISVWSVVAILHGTEQIRQMAQSDHAIFASTPTQAQLSALTDSIIVWRIQQKALDGKWGVSLHISKDLTKRIESGERELALLKLNLQEEKNTHVAMWRYLFLLLELAVLIALILPVWYRVRCVLDEIDKQ